MATARFVQTGITPDEYDQMREKLGVGDAPPAGGVFHAAAVGEDGKIRVFEVWDSREQAEAWGELLCTAVGLPPVPEGVATMPSRRGQRGPG